MRCEKRDYFAEGNCDEVFLNLISELGWLQDLDGQTGNLPSQSVGLLRAKRVEVL
jgi:hypothetical protein